MKQMDLDKNGSLSSKEYKYLEQYFMYDNNKDGVLDKVELGMYLVSLDKDTYELELDVSFNELIDFLLKWKFVPYLSD